MSDGELDPSFFEGRYLVQIETWDWALGLDLMPESAPEEARVHGDLIYTRGVDVRGRILAPRAYREMRIGVWLAPSTIEYWSGPKPLDSVGHFNFREEQRNGLDFSATVLIPDDSLGNVLTCLASTWRYVHLWTRGEFPRAVLTRTTFSRDIPLRLRPWVGDE